MARSWRFQRDWRRHGRDRESVPGVCWGSVTEWAERFSEWAWLWEAERSPQEGAGSDCTATGRGREAAQSQASLAFGWK